MSLGEIGQIIQELQEVDRLINSLEIKAQTLKMEAEHAAGSLREVEYIFQRTLSMIQQAGLPPNIQGAIRGVQQLIIAIRALHSAIIILEMSTTPYGWAKALLTLGMGAVAATSAIESTYDATWGR